MHRSDGPPEAPARSGGAEREAPFLSRHFSAGPRCLSPPPAPARTLLRCLVATTLLGACGDGVSPEVAAEQAPGNVSYSLEWDTSGVEPHRDGGWSVITDLGYEVTLESGWLVTYSVQLVPCPTARAPVRQIIDRALVALNPLQTAHAGHGDVRDVSTAVGIVEDLAVPTIHLRTDLPLGETSYCGLHYLVARADDEVTERPEGVELNRVSVVAIGSWTSSDGTASGDFSISTSTGFGVILDLPEGRIIAPDDAPQLAITRSLAPAFDGVDFESASLVDLERALLRALVESTQVEVK